MSILKAPVSEAQDHPWVQIGPNIHEYRGYFVSKSQSGRDWIVLEPAPSKNVFGYFPTIWNCEEAIDAFCDLGVEPKEEEPDRSFWWVREKAED